MSPAQRTKRKTPTYAKGAKGLCNAFCNAKQCHLPENADNHSCKRLKRNLFKQTGLEDFPCEVVECPCWDEIPNFVGFIDKYFTTVAKNKIEYNVLSSDKSGYYNLFINLTRQSCSIKQDPSLKEGIEFPLSEREFQKCYEKLVEGLQQRPILCNRIPDAPSPGPPCPCWTDEDLASIDVSLVTLDRITKIINSWTPLYSYVHTIEGPGFSLKVDNFDTDPMYYNDYCSIWIDGQTDVVIGEFDVQDFNLVDCKHDLATLSAKAQLINCFELV